MVIPNFTEKRNIPHEQEYNTRHGISAIPNEVCGEIRRQPRQRVSYNVPALFVPCTVLRPSPSAPSLAIRAVPRTDCAPPYRKYLFFGIRAKKIIFSCLSTGEISFSGRNPEKDTFSRSICEKTGLLLKNNGRNSESRREIHKKVIRYR